MTIDAITFEMGGFPSVELQLASSEGLAPLPLPQSLQQPPQDAVRRFLAAMDGDEGEPSRSGVELPVAEGRISRSEAESAEFQRNGDAASKPAFATIAVEQMPHPENPVNSVKPVKENNSESQRAYRGVLFQTGLTGFTGFEKTVEPSETPINVEVATKPDFAPIVVEQTPHSENPVNLVNPVKENNSESQIVDKRELFQTGLTGFTGFERVVEPSETPSNGEVVAKPAVAHIGVDNTPQPENPVNSVNPVKDNNLSALNPVAEPSETPSDGEVVAKPAVAPVVADDTLHPENPVNPVNPVKENNPKPLNSVKETESAATPRVPNSVEEQIEQAEEPRVEVPFVRKERIARNETPEVLPDLHVLHGLTNPTTVNSVNDVSGSVAAAQSARTEAVTTSVVKAVETVNQIVEAVVAEISVTPVLAHGDGEIRITLKPTVLDGSEIRLTAKTGELTVAITPATPEAAETASASLPRLQAALAAHAPAFHHVAVVVATAKKGNER